ncbi:hypothetical protein ABBQ32_013110 [Trebouxia sp. C0010 RCD-2024]
MASSVDTESALTSLDVLIPVDLKRSLRTPETEVMEALHNSGSITKISIVAKANKHDQKRRLGNSVLLARWLEQHGSQLTELVLSMQEAQEVELVLSLFKCPNLQLTKLLVSAADFPSDLLLKLPASLKAFSGHLGAHGDLAPFVALPNLQMLAVRCYPIHKYDGRFTTAAIPAALLHHPSLQFLIIDASSSVYITKSDDVSPDEPVSKLKLLGITGDLVTADVQAMIASAPDLQHLCLRCAPLSQMCGASEQTCMNLDLGKLVDLRATELGFPHMGTKFCGLQQLPKLSAVLLCGQFGAHLPALPKALANAENEPAPELMEGRVIVRRAMVAGTHEKYKINESMSMQHNQLITEPAKLAELSDLIIHGA